MVLSTSTVSMLFRNLRILNGAGATSKFCKFHKTRENKLLLGCGPQYDFVKILSGVLATSKFRERANNANIGVKTVT